MDQLTYIAATTGIVLVALFLVRRLVTGRLVGGGEAKQLVADGATLVDVRSPGEFAAGHIDGAVNIPVGDVSSRASEIPKGHPVVLYCASGIRSGVAARTLRSAGRTDVHNLGGISRWPG
jgi:phage shock protein E